MDCVMNRLADQYERPFPKSEFVAQVGHILSNNASVLAEEFSDLEQISFDTIQRKSACSNTAINRKRNRYHDIVPYDANRIVLNKAISRSKILLHLSTWRFVSAITYLISLKVTRIQ